MYNIKISLPTIDQIKGPNQLDVFNKYGACCTTTDACRITSEINVAKVTKPYLIENKDPMTGEIFIYWLDDIKEQYRAYTDGEKVYYRNEWDYPAIRPILDCPELFDDLLPYATINEVGIPEADFGEYVAIAAPRFLQRKLNHKLDSGTLKRIGESYTWEPRVRNSFEYKKHFVYEYEGKKYVKAQIRYMAVVPEPKLLLSNRCYYHSEDYVWLEVIPWTWLMDEKTKLLISKKAMIAGVSSTYTENMVTVTDFMKNHLLPDLTQSCNKKNFNYAPSEITERKSLLQRIKEKYSNPNKSIDFTLATTHEKRMDDIWTNIEKITDEDKRAYYSRRYYGLKDYYNCYYATINHKNPDKRDYLDYLDRVKDVEDELREYLESKGIKVFHM